MAVAKINPTHVKLLNQYVECCCADDVREELLSKLKNIKGVIHVKHLSLSEGINLHHAPLPVTLSDVKQIHNQALKCKILT